MLSESMNNDYGVHGLCLVSTWIISIQSMDVI